MIYSLLKLVRRFTSNNRANAAIIVALCAVPMFAFLGFAVDYGAALADKAKLDAAADAAVMVALNTAKTIAIQQGGSLTSPVDVTVAGQQAGLKAFAANAGNIAFASVPVPSVTVVPGAAQVLQATVTYSSTAVKTNFSGIIGIKTIPLSGTSSASLKVGTYIDFYLLLDVSGSMGLPTTASGQSQLAAVNPDTPSNCMFACHFSGYQGFATSRSYNIELRADSVESAVCSMISTAISTQQSTGMSNEFRIGIYPFIDYVAEYYPLGNDLTKAINAVTGNTNGSCPTGLTSTGIVNTLDQGASTEPASYPGGPALPMGSGGTHFDNVISSPGSSYGIGQYIKNVGTGTTSSNPSSFIFLVTDGMNNSQVYTQANGFQGGSSPTALYSQQACTDLKNQNVIISILYIPYINVPLVPGTVAEDMQANAQVPSLQAALQACANTGYFKIASTPQDITNAINSMFQQAIQVAHITN